MHVVVRVGSNAMNALKKSSLIVGVVVLVLAVVMGCKNPFQVGLGDKVDLDVPDVALLSHPAGEYLSGTVTLSGVYTDDFEISGITLSFDGGVTLFDATTDAAALTWEYEVNTAEHPDGETEILLTITDLSGKEIQKRILYYFDNAAPLIVLTVPVNVTTPEALDAPPYSSVTFTGEYNGDVVVKGEAGDQFGIGAVEYQVRDSGGVPQTGWIEADGTNSWSFAFDSESLLAPATVGVLRVAVRATDRAGNTSAGVMHTDSVVANNGNASISVEVLVKIVNGEAVAGATIDAARISSIMVPAIFTNINQDADKPDFIVSNPDQDSAIENNVLSSAPRFTGSVEDDNEGIDVDSLSYEIRDLGTDALVASGTLVPATDVSGTDGDLFVRWNFEETGLVDGDYYLIMSATDEQGATGTSGPPYPEFRVDSGAPTVAVSTPSQGAYLNSAFTIIGTATDLQGVTGVQVSVDDGANWLSADNLTGSTPNFNWDIFIDPDDTVDFPPSGLDDGPLNVKIRATDGISTGNFNLTLILDGVLPDASFINPAASSSVNGSVIIRGTASDNNQVTKVELKVGSFDPYVDLSPQLYNWEYTIDSVSYANGTHATETDPGVSNVWKLDVSARITDVANNQQVLSFFFYIDNDLDKPTVNFLSPVDGQVVSGPVVVTGTAVDDDGVGAIYMQIDVDGDGAYDSAAADLSPPAAPGTVFFDETSPILVNGTNAWSYELNNAGNLYYADGYEVDDGWVTLKVWAEDIFATAGNPVEQQVQFDDTIPHVDGLEIDDLPVSSGDYVRDAFVLEAEARDDDAGAVRSVGISFDGGQTYDLLVDAGVIDTDWTLYVSKHADNWFELDIPIDTKSTLPGLAGPITSGILYLRLRVTDFADKESITFINLNVDNLYPTGAWDFGSVDPQEIEGPPLPLLVPEALVQGTAVDTGTVSGFGATHVYFIRTGTLLNPKGVAPGALGTGDFDDGATGPLDITTFDYPVDPNDIIIIDDVNEFGQDGSGNGDDDTYDESITLAAGTYTWWAEFNSNNILDGALDVHFVVFDASGNGTHYEVAGFIKNDRPTIDTLTVGSDLDFSGAVDAGAPEQFEYGGTFDGRQLLYVDIDASDGAGISSYEVFLTNTTTWNGGPLAADTEIDGSGGTPPVIGGTPDYDTGAEIDISLFEEGDLVEFYALVTDGVGITARADFSVNIDNDDDTEGPSGTLGPITIDSVVAGHVEKIDDSRDFSSYDPTDYSADTTADVSGKINITGVVSDDQRIDGIYLQIAGYDPDSVGVVYAVGAKFALASWDAIDDRLEFNSALPAYGPNEILASSFDPITGHSASFSFLWDSSDIATVTAEGVTIDLEVVDRGGTDTADVLPHLPYELTVDVVPYVTGIDRNDGPTQTRTKWGKYTLPDGLQDVLITGYNLNPDGAYIYNTGGAASTDISGTIADIDTTDYLSFTIDLNGAGTDYGGYLWIVDGTVIAINNFNDNTLEQNMQDDGSGIPGTLWRDDLYIQLWDVGNDFNGSNDAAHPAMAVASDSTQFAAWSYYTDSLRRYGTDTASRNSYATWPTVYDPPEWNDIAFNHARNDDYFIVNLWNQNAVGVFEALQLHAFEDPTTMSDDTDMIVIDDLEDILFQYRNPRIAVKNAADANESVIYVSYYDANTSTTALKFASFNYDNAGNDLSRYLGSTNVIVDNTADVGLWSDIGIDGDGIPFIVYYDTTNSTLKIARADDDTTDGDVTWDIAVVDGGLSYFGEYVSVAVDYNGTLGDSSDDTIHISTYRNATGDLIYYTAPHVTTGTDFDFATAGRTYVDENGSVGAWSEIAVYGGEPYIAYISTGHVGTPLGLKYAYFDGAQWEHGTVPVTNPVQSVRTGIVGNPQALGTLASDLDYTVSIGYNSGMYYFARLRPEQ